MRIGLSAGARPAGPVDGQPHPAPPAPGGSEPGDGVHLADPVDVDHAAAPAPASPAPRHDRPGQRPGRLRRAAPSGARRPRPRRRRRRPRRARRRRAAPSSTAGVAEEQRGLGVGRGAPHLGDRALLDDPAGPHHREPVGDRERLLVVVGDHQRGGAGRAQDRAQVGGEPLAQPGVERRQRLVEQQQPRLDGQRAGQRDPLPLAAGQRARAAGRRTPRGRPGRAARRPARAAAAARGRSRSA